tara:strand:- start:339 stop:440 length:102 start_codon:yes stop_codon:yes gene_type:complete
MAIGIAEMVNHTLVLSGAKTTGEEIGILKIYLK